MVKVWSYNQSLKKRNADVQLVFAITEEVRSCNKLLKIKKRCNAR